MYCGMGLWLKKALLLIETVAKCLYKGLGHFATKERASSVRRSSFVIHLSLPPHPPKLHQPIAQGCEQLFAVGGEGDGCDR